ncbi:unnamed protein product [Polarella glacialis]|uniref:Uncharacterized protein n=1 Tax=Polarella glacialis TaxID=89957 RepID=A0A813D760_POLGL|nr:unnamed protein product [Polarella glacialis]
MTGVHAEHTAEAEAASLTKQVATGIAHTMFCGLHTFGIHCRWVHVLSFRLEEADEKIRRLEAEKSHRATVSRAPPALLEGCIPEQAEASALSLRTSVEELAQERELRARAQEQILLLQERHVAEVRALSTSLRKAEDESEKLRTEFRSAARQPTSSELRWQQEALRLRDDLAEVRKAWKAVDSRGLMQRDKELRKLGLDAKALEESVPKSDLVSILLEVCRLLRASDFGEIVSKVSACLARNPPAPQPPPQPALEELGQGVLDALKDLDGLSAAPAPAEALVRLRSLCASEAGARQLRLSVREVSLSSAAPGGASPASEAWPEVARQLQLPEGATQEDCRRRLCEVHTEAALLASLSAALKCSRPGDEPLKRVEALVRLCDERVAAQRIVDALQKLLHVDELTEVLPALKEVLDVAALRRKMVRSACNATAAARSQPAAPLAGPGA